MPNDTIKKLMEEIRRLEDSSENQKRKQKWARLQKTSRDQWRGTPKTDGTAKMGAAPVQMDCNTGFWGNYLGYKVSDYYQKPEVFLENHLKMKLARFRLFEDDTFLEKRVPIWMGSAFEASLIGMRVVYGEDADPWIDFKYFLKDEEALKRIPEFDFYHSGQMEDAVRIYEYCKENLDDDFEPIFPEWERGPFGVATYARGYEDVLLDMVGEEDFADQYMKFFTERQIQYFEAREKYLGEATDQINLYNDEVNTPTVSPALYEEWILPYEVQLSQRFGGLNYWHSCGNLDRLLPSIYKVPGIEMIHKGPWTSAKAEAEIFGQRCAIEVCLNPEKDIIRQEEPGMYQVIYGICRELNTADAKGYTIRANNIGVMGSSQQTIAKGQSFIKTARKAVADAAVN